MQDLNNREHVDDLNDEIDLKEIFLALNINRKIIVYTTAFISFFGIIYSLSLPNIYKSEALLAPIDVSSSLVSGALSEYSGLAGLAGINLSTGNNSSNSKKAIEVMGSLSFYENYLMPRIFLPDLMALDYWDDKNNKIIYDESIYKKDTDSWVRDFSYPKKLIPSAQESFEVFKEEHFNMQEDINSGYIVLSINHQSPVVAKQWVEIIFEEINDFYRLKDKSQSEKAVIYLNNQMVTNNLSEIRQVTASLMQNELQKLTLIEANKDYVFEYIYPPNVMEKKSKPRRTLIALISLVLGGLLGILIALTKYYVGKGKED